MKLLVSTVIRKAKAGKVHGNLYLIDLKKNSFDKIADWKNPNINWEGRGGSRGLRGISFHRGKIYIAACSSIYVYDKRFNIINTLECGRLLHCHETSIYNNKLYITSTGYDSVIIYDFSEKEFTEGYCFRGTKNDKVKLKKFDPNKNNIRKGDSIHINNVFVNKKGMFVSGIATKNIIRVSQDYGKLYCSIPTGTHNARPYNGGIIYNYTAKKRVIIDYPGCKSQINVPIQSNFTGRSTQNITPGWNRGLCMLPNGLIAIGSAPASVHILNNKSVIKTIQLSNQLVNAVHGLEVWVFE